MSSKDIGSILDKLDKAIGKKKPAGQTDWKEIKALKEKSFTKLQPGKNYIAVVPLDTKDPFVIWGYHNSLQETSFWSVPCDAFNKDKECIVCNVIDELQKENESGNKHIWYPIRQQFEFYAPVVNLESETTIKEGAKWLRFGKLIMSQFKDWLSNTDDDEEEFYSDDEPQKIIISYDKSAAPADMYKLDKKNLKPFSDTQLETWRKSLPPVEDFIYSKSQDELKKIVDKYFERIADTVALTPPVTDAPVDDEDEDDEDTETVDAIPSKLDRFKKK